MQPGGTRWLPAILNPSYAAPLYPSPRVARPDGPRSLPARATSGPGLTKVGRPGATLGLQKEDPTIAEMLKPLGYATGQFGKNHLGDRNEYLPTVHGFDEFYGNLYHLNAEEEPELPDYPKDPAFRAKFGSRGVMDCKASDKDDPAVDPRFGKVGKQVCTDTGPRCLNATGALSRHPPARIAAHSG
jgi:arylsulfatase A-like enzyme